MQGCMTHRIMNKVLLIAVLGLLASCSDSGTDEARRMAVTNTPGLSGTQVADADTRKQVLHSMPTPNDLFHVLGVLGKSKDRNVLFNPLVAKEQVDVTTLAFRFGICATDVAYSSYSGRNADVLRYYLILKEMAQELGLEDAVQRIEQQKLERNLSNGDSLSILTNEAYINAYRKLDEQNRGDLLATILAGGWVESTYLVAQRITEFDPSDPMVLNLMDQKVSLAHVIELTEINATESSVHELRKELLVMQDIFDKVPSVRQRSEKTKAKGKLVIGESETFELNEEKFLEIKAFLEKLRNSRIGETGVERS